MPTRAEHPREENRCRPQEFIGLFQVFGFGLGLQGFDLGDFLVSGAGAVLGVDLGSNDPAAQCLGSDAQLRGEVLESAVDGLVAVQAVKDLGDDAGLDFSGVLLGHVLHSLK